MDWDEIIERNRERILAAIAPLLAVLGFDPRRRGEMPRHFYRSLLILLRPAESAVRRLIIIAARGIVLKLRLDASSAFPAGLAQRLKMALEKDVERIPAFQLIDPLKRFAPQDFEWREEEGKEEENAQILPRISVPGLFDPAFPQTEPAFIPADDDPINTSALLRRIRSLKDALENLPRHARRLARWKARGELARGPDAARKIGRLTPFRPGFAPGFRRAEKRDIDAILGDCHYFARQAFADTS
jgi:hypothetical protein